MTALDQPTPDSEPKQRNLDRSVVLLWSVGERTAQGRPHARLSVAYDKTRGGYVASLDIVQLDGAFERSYPFGPRTNILTVSAPRFSASKLEQMVDSALAQLRYQFLNGDPVVLMFFDPALMTAFDGTTESIQDLLDLRGLEIVHPKRSRPDL